MLGSLTFTLSPGVLHGCRISINKKATGFSLCGLWNSEDSLGITLKSSDIPAGTHALPNAAGGECDRQRE